jgi:hypothetical protein
VSEDRIFSIRKDRRASLRTAADPAEAAQAQQWADKRVHCWDIQRCDPKLREDCYAYYVGQNCWDLWAARSPERKYCCQKIVDCRNCGITQAKFGGRVLPIYVPVRQSPITRPQGSPVYQSATCRYFFIEGLEAIPTDARTIKMLIRSLSREERDAFRCRFRHVHLEWSYVSDICASVHHSQCVFLDDK